MPPQRVETAVDDLAALLRAEAKARGGIPFERWMEACLYHPEHGYYMRSGRKTGAGADADFVTPPTLHPFFGQAVGRELAALHAADGAPRDYAIVEYGGGEGTLATAALTQLEQAPAVRWLHVERSPTHRPAPSQDPRIAFARDGQGGDVGVFCEVLDAIPSPATAQGRLVRVQADGDAFRPDGAIDAVDGTAAAAWLAQRAPALRHVVVIDYGSRQPARGVRAFHRHEHADPFSDPGRNDITFDVDFAAVAATMAAAGFAEASYESLEAFLLRHGILEELNAVDRTTVEGASSYLRLRQLLLPTGMGAAFRVARFDRVTPA